MKKSEMEYHADAYRTKMRAAGAAEQRGLYRLALESAVSAWEHIDGMMRFERKYGDAEFTSIPAIDLALKYAPLLLDRKLLTQLETLLRDYKRIQKNATDDISERVARAHSQISENHRLWSHLEKHPGVLQSSLSTVLGGDQTRWRSVAESWEKMGLVSRTPESNSHRLSLATRMGAVVPGKCPSCGAVEQAPKAILLEKIACPKCRKQVTFILLEAA